VADAPPPFWPRIRRALIVLMIAVAAHVWVVPSTKRDAHDSATAARPSAATSIASTIEHTATVGERIADSVRVLHTLSLARPLEDEWTRPLMPMAVGTAGLVAATYTVPMIDPPSPPRANDPRAAAEGSAPVAPTPIAALSMPSPLQRLANRVTALSPQAGLVDPTADGRRRDEEIVRRILRDYTRAYERMDVEAARTLWPSVDVRALQRAFERLDGQQLRLGSCGVAFAGQAANARCQGDAVYRPKVGTRVLHLTGREWTFNLSRSHSGWQIVNAQIQ
jgi:hypothetical protein